TTPRAAAIAPVTQHPLTEHLPAIPQHRRSSGPTVREPHMSDQLSTAYAGDRAAALIVEPYKAELREIVVFLDGRTKAKGILEFAGVLAQEHGAHLIGVFIQPEPTVTPPETFARGTGIVGVIEAHRAQLEAIEADHRALFEDIVRREGIRSEWRALSYSSSDVAEHAHYADLAVIARADPANQLGGPCG